MVNPTVNSTAANPYSMTTSSFTNDVFASKYYKTPVANNNVPAKLPVFMQTEPTNKAQAILQQFYMTNNPGGLANGNAPTAQDYYLASQIASMFSGNNQIPVTKTSFAQNDMFAQSLFA